jgi:hypothetical protein
MKRGTGARAGDQREKESRSMGERGDVRLAKMKNERGS